MKPVRAPTIACCALPQGYGPVAKLLVLAAELSRRGFRPVFLGNGTSRELAARSSTFAELVPLAPEEARAVIRSSVGLLSLMDREYTAVALEESRPVCVVDSLFWMRHEIPAVFLRADRYFVQDFIGVRERLDGTTPRPTAVGPIVPRSQAPARRRARLVVNLGACDAASASDDDWRAYVDFVVRGLLESGILSRFPEPPLLMTGNRCVRHLRESRSLNGLELASVAHEEAVAILRSAAMVLTAPGLTATLECFQHAAPTFFLPPQVYSQWWILSKLRALGLAPGAFHWEDLTPASPVVEGMPEATRAPLVRDAIRTLVTDERARRSLRDGLASSAAHDASDLARRQRAFFDSLGANGVEQIVGNVIELCQSNAGGHA